MLIVLAAIYERNYITMYIREIWNIVFRTTFIMESVSKTSQVVVGSFNKISLLVIAALIIMARFSAKDFFFQIHLLIYDIIAEFGESISPLLHFKSTSPYVMAPYSDAFKTSHFLLCFSSFLFVVKNY